MKTSFTTMATPGLSLDEIIDAAKKYKFDCVDLRVRNDGEIPADLTDKQADDVKSKLDKAGIKLLSLFCYNDTIKSGKENMEKSILKHIEIAEKIDAVGVRIFSGKIETDEEFEDLCIVLENVLEKYKGNINIFMQNHSSNGLSCKQGINLCDRVKDSRLSFIFSPDECFKTSEEYMDILPEIAKITKQMYIADITKEKKYCLIGDGVIKFKEIIGQMKDNGFDGYLTLKWEKCWCDYLPFYEEGFKSFFRYLYDNNFKIILFST